MSRLNAFENEIANSTSEIALGFLKNYFVYCNRDHIVFKKAFEENTETLLEGLKQKRSIEVSRHMMIVGESRAAIDTCRINLQKSKKMLKKSYSDLQSAEAKAINCQTTIIEQSSRSSSTNSTSQSSRKTMYKYMTFGMESNPENDLLKLQKKISKFREEIDCAILDNKMKKKALHEAIEHYDEAVGNATEMFQQLELSRLEILKTSLASFCQLEKQTLTSKLNHLEVLQTAITNMKPAADIELFINSNLTSNSHALAHITNSREFNITKLSKVLGILDWDCSRR